MVSRVPPRRASQQSGESPKSAVDVVSGKKLGERGHDKAAEAAAVKKGRAMQVVPAEEDRTANSKLTSDPAMAKAR